MSMKKMIELDDFAGIKKSIISGEDVNAVDRMGVTALMRAVVLSDVTMVNWLLNKKAFVDQVDSNGMSALHYAALHKALEIGKILIAHGANVNLQDKKNGKTPIGYSIDPQNMIFAKLLLQHGAKTDIPNNRGITVQQAYGSYLNELV